MHPDIMSDGDRELAHAVRDRSELKDIRIYSISGKHNLQPMKPVEFEVQIQIEARIRPKTEEEKCSLFVLMNFEIVAKAAKGGTGEFEAKIAYELVYSMTSLEGLGDGHYVPFAMRVAIYNAWPYLREKLHSMSLDMGLSPLKLPLYRPAKDQPAD